MYVSSTLLKISKNTSKEKATGSKFSFNFVCLCLCTEKTRGWMMSNASSEKCCQFIERNMLKPIR